MSLNADTLPAVSALVREGMKTVEWQNKHAAGHLPTDDVGTISTLLEMVADDERVVAASIELARVLRATGGQDVPSEIQPECEFVAQAVGSVTDVSALQAVMQTRSARLRDLLVDGKPAQGASRTVALPAPYDGEWAGIRRAVTLLCNQVQIYNATRQQEAMVEAARQQGVEVHATSTRSDDGSSTSIVQFAFNPRSEPERRRWWHRFTRRAGGDE
ncbi:hypothetical protein [Microbacterium sp. AG238]|uniref:hypothetical protein n=1 Tax=Microbacterium sp. AG238 TaxID=2183994 RepID=UPI000E772252|nr:hypothetical protein [Microbacterium sp. AG238]RKE64930.1 hypothetical protein DEU36_2167 [Microbacterium sp. AG238]